MIAPPRRMEDARTSETKLIQMIFQDRLHRQLAQLLFVLFATLALASKVKSQSVEISEVGYGWSSTSVNTVIFRRNSLVTGDDNQYIAYYDTTAHVVLGMRRLAGSSWQLVRTPFTGNVRDAHNSISIMVDGDGYVHLAWDHHNHPLHYARSVEPHSLEMGEMMPMIGMDEQRVTYPEFHRLPDGDLVFMYRDGESGDGRLVLNRYNTKMKQWSRIQRVLIDGESKRNAYWQAYVDTRGIIHLSWVWRESPDVASNHDICYARSRDRGLSWETSSGVPYALPITQQTAEVAVPVPQNRELINQTSMYVNERGVPFIASYWRDSTSTIPQYRIIYKRGKEWRVVQVFNRTTPFTLSGGGTKRIPIARPQLVADGKNVGLIFRDEERGSRVSIAYSKNMSKGKFEIRDLLTDSVGAWEPTYDTELWKAKKILSLFVQMVGQGDGEREEALRPQMVCVLNCDLQKAGAPR